MENTISMEGNQTGSFRELIFVVSDVHLGSKFFFDPIQKQKFWQFLEEIGNNPKTRELILNGDIIETWSSPIAEVYSLENIFAHDDVVRFATLIRIMITKGVKVVYIIGNHDCRVTEAAIKDLLGPQVEVGNEYVQYGIHFSHGHKYDYFNSTDPTPNDVPVGYYATRIDHTHDIGLTHQRRDSVRDTLDKILPDLTSSRLLVAEKTIISAFMTHMFVKARPIYTLWKTGGIPRIINEKGEGETMSNISRRLYPSYRAWANEHSREYVAATLRCAVTADYQWFLENGHYGQVTHVIHGHTHNGLSKIYYTLLGHEILYMNDGAWENDRMCYVRVTLTPELKVDACELITIEVEK